MGKILSSLPKTIHTSLAISILLFLGLFFNNEGFDIDRIFWSWLFRYIHVVVGIMWIGLLWYFNFVQIPNMAKIPDIYVKICLKIKNNFNFQNVR